MPAAKMHWGAWMLERARLVGFHRQVDLAAAVGCRREQIARWGAMSEPPKQVRKGFDDGLALALKTSKQILFIDYAKVRPEDANWEWVVPGKNMPWHSPDWTNMSPHEQLKCVMYYVPSDMVNLLVMLAMKVADSAQQQQLNETREGLKQKLESGMPLHPSILPIPPELLPTPPGIKNPKGPPRQNPK